MWRLGGLAAVLMMGCTLAVPDNLTMVIDDSTQGPCGRYSWHDNTIHIREDCSWAVPTDANEGKTLVVFHELCHAHQDIDDAKDWPVSNEGKSYAEAIRGHGLNGGSLVEDFAYACGRYYFDRAEAVQRYPYRVDWMIENLPPLPPEIPEWN